MVLTSGISGIEMEETGLRWPRALDPGAVKCFQFDGFSIGLVKDG
jgi:hypothetical protein